MFTGFRITAILLSDAWLQDAQQLKIKGKVSAMVAFKKKNASNILLSSLKWIQKRLKMKCSAYHNKIIWISNFYISFDHCSIFMVTFRHYTATQSMKHKDARPITGGNEDKQTFEFSK